MSGELSRYRESTTWRTVLLVHETEYLFHAAKPSLGWWMWKAVLGILNVVMTSITLKHPFLHGSDPCKFLLNAGKLLFVDCATCSTIIFYHLSAFRHFEDLVAMWPPLPLSSALNILSQTSQCFYPRDKGLKIKISLHMMIRSRRCGYVSSHGLVSPYFIEFFELHTYPTFMQ